MKFTHRLQKSSTGGASPFLAKIHPKLAFGPRITVFCGGPLTSVVKPHHHSLAVLSNGLGILKCHNESDRDTEGHPARRKRLKIEKPFKRLKLGAALVPPG
jgi:hypothetical protein